MRTAISVLALVLGVLVCGSVGAQTDCSETRAVLWLHVPEDVLEDLLNRAVPEQMEGIEEYRALLLLGERIEWSMDRSSISLAMGENLIQARTTVTGSVKIKGRSLIGTDFSAGPDLTIDAELSLQPRLVGGWHLFPNATASARVNEAQMKILGFKVGVRKQAQRALDKFLARTVERINIRLADGQFLRKEVERIWNGMHRIDRVSIGQLPGDPQVWLVSRPTRIKATSLRVNEAGLDFGVSLFAETSFVVGDEPRLTTQQLPPLEIDDNLPDGEIELALPIYTAWNTLDDLIAAHLEKPVIHEGDDYRATVTGARLSNGPEDSVIAFVMAKVKPKGWIGWIFYFIHRISSAIGLDTEYLRIYTDHKIAVSARPVVSEDGRRIVFKDAGLMPQSAYLMKTLAAKRIRLTEESVREYVEKHVVLDLDEQLAEAEKMAREKIDEITGKLGDRGIDLNVEIRPVTRLASVSKRSGGLIARFCAATDLDAKILRFGF